MLANYCQVPQTSFVTSPDIAGWYVVSALASPLSDSLDSELRATKRDVNDPDAPAFGLCPFNDVEMKTPGKRGLNCKARALCNQLIHPLDAKRPAPKAAFPGAQGESRVANSSGLTISSTRAASLGAYVLLPAPLGQASSHNHGVSVIRATALGA